MSPEPTQTYMAKSAFTDLTNISAFIMALLQLGGVEGFLDGISTWLMTLMPGAPFSINLVKLLEFVAAVTILIHRTFFANNPVTMIAPMQVKPVEVKSLTPTQPPDPPKE